MLVRFALLKSLVSSGRRREPRRGELVPGLVFATLHLALLGSVALAAPEEGAAPPPLETVTYLDIPTPTEPASPRTVVRPRPVVVSQAVRIPAVEGEVSRPDKAAGFQELLAPREISQLPAPGTSGAAVDERDFSGRGVVGGVAGGKPPVALPPDVAAAMAVEGRITDAATRTVARQVKPVEMAAVEIKPQLLNRDDAMKLLHQHWPPVLRQAGIEGSVIVQFVIDTSGLASRESIRVFSASHPQFAGAAMTIVPQLRFSPGRMSVAGRMMAVPVQVRIPLKWTQLVE